MTALALAARRQTRPTWLDSMLFILEGGLVVRAMIGVGVLASGQHTAQPVTHIAYLVSSVALLPLTLSSLAEDRTHWSLAVLAVVCLAVLVIAIRIQMTSPGHA